MPKRDTRIERFNKLKIKIRNNNNISPGQRRYLLEKIKYFKNKLNKEKQNKEIKDKRIKQELSKKIRLKYINKRNNHVKINKRIKLSNTVNNFSLIKLSIQVSVQLSI